MPEVVLKSLKAADGALRERRLATSPSNLHHLRVARTINTAQAAEVIGPGPALGESPRRPRPGNARSEGARQADRCRARCIIGAAEKTTSDVDDES